jgi:hypothetical protein
MLGIVGIEGISFLMKAGAKPCPFYRGSLPKQCKQHGQDDADDNRGSNREVESELLFLDDDVTREFADPRNLPTY